MAGHCSTHVDCNEYQNLQREAEYLYQDTQKVQARNCQQSEIILFLEQRIRELEEFNAVLKQERLTLQDKLTYVTEKNASLKQKLTGNMAAHRDKEVAFAELAKRREEIDVMHNQLDELTENVDEYQYQTECLMQYNEYLTSMNDELSMIELNERKARHDLEYQLLFLTRINEMLNISYKNEKNRCVDLERKLKLSSSEWKAIKLKVGNRFSLEPRPMFSCIRCGACLSKLDETANVCRYHLYQPVSYPGWKYFEPTLKSSSDNSVRYKYWPCCNYFGITEPDGCQELKAHIF